jgi:hypothetical protein
MSAIRFLMLVLTAITLVTSASVHAQEDRAAIDSFVKQMKEHDAFCEQLAATMMKTPGGGVVLFRTVSARVQNISTAGLPADLEAAFKEYATCAKAVVEVFKDFPEKPPEIVAYMRRKIAENPNFQREEEKRNAPTIVAFGQAIEKVEAAGRKHGIEGLAALLQ